MKGERDGFNVVAEYEGLGSVKELSDGNGDIVNRYRYRGFGLSLVKTEGVTNEFQYTARRNEGNGLYYYRFRYYRPDAGRFVNWDRMFAGGHYYDML